MLLFNEEECVRDYNGEEAMFKEVIRRADR